MQDIGGTHFLEPYMIFIAVTHFDSSDLVNYEYYFDSVHHFWIVYQDILENPN